MKKFQLLLLAGLLLFAGCSKKDGTPASPDSNNTPPDSNDEAIVSYSLKGENLPVTVHPDLKSVDINFPDTIRDANNLVANFTLSSGCIASINNVQQTSGSSKNSYNAPLVYTVSYNTGNSTNWTVYSFNNNYTNDWGMGGFLQDSAANNRSYSWYIDQMTTGFDSGNNCGPSCVTMVCKWADSTFNKTAHDARMKYVPQGGWWYTNDIDSYLYDNNVNHKIVSLPATADDTRKFLKRQIDLKQIVLFCIDMNSIRQCQDGYYHTDKFYSTTPGWGHFFIVKGYKDVDGETFCEVYDPNSWGDRNTDGTLKGQNRYYRYEDVFAAANVWWQYAFIISKKGTAVTENITPRSSKNIPVQYGR